MKNLKIEKIYKDYVLEVSDCEQNNTIRIYNEYEGAEIDYEDIDDLIAWLSWFQQEWSQRNMMKDILEQ